MRAATQRSTSTSASVAFRSVLVPIDLTPVSDRVLGRLSLLPLADDARVTLVHVVPASLPREQQRDAARDAEAALADESRHLRTQLSKKVAIELRVERGVAAKEIAACATEANVELIVMGRGGGRALREAFLGSTAERVIRQAQLPVLVVRRPPRTPYRRPAIALAFDPAADEVVRVMLVAVPPPRPRVAVIHAYDTPYRGRVYGSLPPGEAEERKEELRSQVSHQLTRVLASALSKAKVRSEDRPIWEKHVRYGSPRTVVERATQKAENDLLVLGTRGFSGAAYVLLGTVAGDLLRAAKCDVLVVPPPRSARSERN